MVTRDTLSRDNDLWSIFCLATTLNSITIRTHYYADQYGFHIIKSFLQLNPKKSMSICFIVAARARNDFQINQIVFGGGGKKQKKVEIISATLHNRSRSGPDPPLIGIASGPTTSEDNNSPGRSLSVPHQ